MGPLELARDCPAAGHRHKRVGLGFQVWWEGRSSAAPGSSEVESLWSRMPRSGSARPQMRIVTGFVYYTGRRMQ